MSFAPTGRVGLRQEISGFVVREDDSLEARIRRSAAGQHALIMEKLLALRARISERAPSSRRDEAQDSAPPVDGPLAATPRELEAAVARAFAEDSAVEEKRESPETPTTEAIRPPARDWRKTARLHLAAALIRGNQLRIIALERLRPGERLRDLAALAWPATKWCLRAGLAAPRWVKVISAILIGLFLAPWPEAAPPPAAIEAAAPESAPSAQRPRDALEGWRAVPANLTAYHLEAPELDRSALKYRMRSPGSGGRQDVLSWHEETSDAQRPKNRFSGAISIEHYPNERPSAQSLFTDAARRAAWLGLSVERMAEAFAFANKFGAVEAVETILSQGGEDRACLVFRHVADAAPVQIHGWFCGAAQRPLDRATLACVIDRIDLLGAGGDRQLKSYFAAIERQRRACGAYPAPQSAPTAEAGARLPELRASFSELPRRAP